jgi:hypothetical protein
MEARARQSSLFDIVYVVVCVLACAADVSKGYALNTLQSATDSVSVQWHGVQV